MVPGVVLYNNHDHACEHCIWRVGNVLAYMSVWMDHMYGEGTFRGGRKYFAT